MYERGRLIGEGGAAEVYVSHEERVVGGERVQRDLVVKALRDSARQHDAQRARRFELECLVGYELATHPNLIPTRDWGDGWLAADLVGPTVEQLQNDGFSFTESLVRTALLDWIAALDVFHRADLVHGDVNRANLYVGRDGHFKLGDYGSVRVKSSSREPWQDYRRLRKVAAELLGCGDPLELADDLGQLLFLLEAPQVRAGELREAIWTEHCLDRAFVARVARDCSSVRDIPLRQSLAARVRTNRERMRTGAKPVVAVESPRTRVLSSYRWARDALLAACGALAAVVVVFGVWELFGTTTTERTYESTPVGVRASVAGVQLWVGEVEWVGEEAVVTYCVHNGTDVPLPGPTVDSAEAPAQRTVDPGRVGGGRLRVRGAERGSSVQLGMVGDLELDVDL